MAGRVYDIDRKRKTSFDCKVQKGVLIIRTELAALPIVGSHFSTSLFEGTVAKVVLEKRNGVPRHIIIVE